MSINQDQIIDAVSKMSVMDVMKLVSAMEKKFGVSSSVSVSNKDSHSIKQVEEKTEFDIYLKNFGSNKISVIKAIRSTISLGLKEAKDLVESAPVLIKGSISKIEVDKIKDILEKAGAQIEIK
ncbi:50S ribosomal protein L7/L12 [Candidatus Purcelliella pentastirinorum]|uniref:Large ribosomal subunit protein bL12 n=1 Tax=Candidatus Purcelliella pentastirinorum TaxID=472834 RepID=A0AAX3N8U9_9ENTR|nr:50S ribosomal protein L7/L12 [Candidatus Purcelliella pentastirinorum]WDI78434.1 50S ribosomal protein L7/L12 [Candidatus Purcelliella pentastirinorum]WDR80537.1 50S ribosomal protein L7/L12 [Candidatus Purcelliella pentastirinorum]